MMLNPLFFFEAYGSDANYHPGRFINESVAKPAHVFSPEDVHRRVGGHVDDQWSNCAFYSVSPLEKVENFSVPNYPQCSQNFMEINYADLERNANVREAIIRRNPW